MILNMNFDVFEAQSLYNILSEKEKALEDIYLETKSIQHRNDYIYISNLRVKIKGQVDEQVRCRSHDSTFKTGLFKVIHPTRSDTEITPKIPS